MIYKTTDLDPVQCVDAGQGHAQRPPLVKLDDHGRRNKDAIRQGVKDVEDVELIQVLDRRGIVDEVRQGASLCALPLRSGQRCLRHSRPAWRERRREAPPPG